MNKLKPWIIVHSIFLPFIIVVTIVITNLGLQTNENNILTIKNWIYAP